MINFKGTPFNILEVIIGKISHKNKCDGYILLTDSEDAIFSTDSNIPIIYVGAIANTSRQLLALQEDDAVTLEENDIVSIHPDGTCTILYRSSWRDLGLFLTNACNSHCVMCPQTSVEDHGSELDTCRKIIALQPENVERIGITGGEPTCYQDDLVELLELLHDKYPTTRISVLTNGRRLSDAQLVNRISSIKHRNLVICVPLYAANNNQHDAIVGAQNAFVETIKGILNLYNAGIAVEIRMVLYTLTYKYLREFSQFVYRNLPFVYHIAFMGMEYSGNAKRNSEKFWIDPYDYQAELDSATWLLHQRGMNVSVYNIPLCLLKQRTRQFARDSISAWKKNYHSICESCSAREGCSGFFTTSSIHSAHIQAVI